MTKIAKISNGEHDNLMHNAYYAVELIAKSLKRQNALEATRQAWLAGYISEEHYKKMLQEVLINEGFAPGF